MVSVWVGKEVSVDTLHNICKCFSSVCSNTEMSAAVRLARMCNAKDLSDEINIREAVKKCIEDQVASLNYHYDCKAQYGDNLLVTLSLFMPVTEADALIRGVSGQEQLDVQIDIDGSTGRFVVSGKLVDKVW